MPATLRDVFGRSAATTGHAYGRLYGLDVLIAGASLGPEAPLADACGGIGTLLSDRLKLRK
jgi:H+/Cl- antiporter ClcA